MTEYQQNDHYDCEDCVRERRENQIWINIYERMQILRDKVGKINAKVKDYQQKMRQTYNLSKLLNSSICMVTATKDRSDNTVLEKVGYEIAIGLQERIIRQNMKSENRELKMRIQSLRQQAKRQQLEKLHLNQAQNKLIKSSWLNQNGQSLNFSINQCKTIGISQLSKRYWKSGDCYQACSTNSSFKQPQIKSTNEKQNKYKDLNLWLYSDNVTGKLQQTFNYK